MQVGEREEKRRQRAMGVLVQPSRDSSVERNERGAAGDVPRDREEDQAGDEKRAPARDCQRARRKARRVRLAKLGRRASVHGARGRLLLRLALLRGALGFLRVSLGLALRLARLALGLLLRARLGGFLLRFLAGLARLL